MIPFVQIYSWWANGIAGVIPSALAYLAACAGFYRLARRWLRRLRHAGTVVLRHESQSALPPDHGHDRAALLCEMIWIALWLVEWRASSTQIPGKPVACSVSSPPRSSPPSSRAMTAG
jgi:hypothetical protein